MVKKRNNNSNKDSIVNTNSHTNISMNTHSILSLLKEKRVITSSELAGSIGVSWNTADKWLLELALQGKVERIKKSGVNLWMLK